MLDVTYTAKAPVPSLELSMKFARAASCRIPPAVPGPKWTQTMARDVVVVG